MLRRRHVWQFLDGLKVHGLQAAAEPEEAQRDIPPARMARIAVPQCFQQRQRTVNGLLQLTQGDQVADFNLVEGDPAEQVTGVTQAGIQERAQRLVIADIGRGLGSGGKRAQRQGVVCVPGGIAE